MSILGHNCRICHADALEEVVGFESLARVTSDCKAFPANGRLATCTSCGAIQKPTDARWQEEAAAIYEEYAPYSSSDGAEQSVFDVTTGQPSSRSDVILKHLSRHQPFAGEGRLLDVGCGNGVMLSAFSRLDLNWRLDGQDISTVNLSSLQKIPGFGELHTKDLKNVSGTYDLITLMHSLEHFTDPGQGLRDLKHLINDEGYLLVQVPNIEATPFDLLIADHVSHFTEVDLVRLFGDAGLTISALADDWVTKELSVVARVDRSGTVPKTMPDRRTPDSARQVKAQIDWLRRLSMEAYEAARSAGSFGIFGTSISATWLLSELGDLVDFFVDEDPHTHGRQLDGRPIFAPTTVPRNSTIYLPLIPSIAKRIVHRLSSESLDLRAPPEFHQPTVDIG